MCGIIGYTGNRKAVPILIQGLKKLEYRGYDSAGLAVSETTDGDMKMHVVKEKGKVSNLENSTLDIADMVSHAGIAHTRWATHGPATQANAHPHASGRGGIALVHNGIIENYQSIKAKLITEGYTFQSETDSEALVHLIDFYLKSTEDFKQAVIYALKDVVGTYGVCCMAESDPGTIIVARKGSPIILGLGDDETFIASDAAAIIHYTRQVIYLDDGDVASIKGSDVNIYNLEATLMSRPVSEIDWSEDASSKGGYDHYMLKEIMEQPQAIRDTMRGRLDMDRGNAILSGLNISPRELITFTRVVILGCGTSMNAGAVGEYALEDFAGVISKTEQAAEFRYRNPIITSKDLVVAISQSGETADTLAAVREAQDKGALVASLVNVVGSTIARETKRGLYLHAGPEISVASTKAFTCQVTALLLVALRFARSRRMSREQGVQYCKNIEVLPELAQKVIDKSDSIAEVAKAYVNYESMFFIGRGYMYPVAMEGALKLKEISYIHAEAYHAAELKHGPLALLTENMPVLAILNDCPGKEKNISNVMECHARMAPIIGVVTEGDEEAMSACDHYIEIPRSAHFTTTITASIALQLFAYHVAKLRGCPIDQPRNLAKSVTVE